MANITVTEVGDGLATIVAAEALGYLKANTVMTRLASRNWDNEVALFGQTVDIPFTGGLTVNDKAANTVVTLQTPADTKTSVTLNKHKEVSFLIEDVAKAMAKPDYLASYMADGMSVMAEQIDRDLLALYSGFSQTIDATAGMDEADFREAQRRLNAAKVPSRGRWAVLHEDAVYELGGIEKFVNQDYTRLHSDMAEEPSLADAFQGHFMGFDIYMDQVVPVATAVCKNLFGHRAALGLVTRPLPITPAGMGVIQKAMSEDDIGLRITMGYDKGHLGMQVTIDVLYGVAEVRDNHAVVVSTTEI